MFGHLFPFLGKAAEGLSVRWDQLLLGTGHRLPHSGLSAQDAARSSQLWNKLGASAGTR